MQLNWQEAIDFCQNLEFAGHSDWRLPTRKELESLIDVSRCNPALPVGHPFLNVQSDNYWTFSTNASFSNYAWNVYMYFGYVDYNNKSNYFYVWPVRGGQLDVFGDLIIPGRVEGQERFTDNLDGTITDNRTGLIWIKDLNPILHGKNVIDLTKFRELKIINENDNDIYGSKYRRCDYQGCSGND